MTKGDNSQGPQTSTDERTIAQNHLSNYNVDMKTAEDFFINNLSNLKFIHDICKQFGVDNDMIAAILANRFSGLTGRDVANYFATNGIDTTDLGGSAPTIHVKNSVQTGSVYQGNYNGTFSGYRNGTWNAIISPDGTISGSAIDNQGYNYNLQGHMRNNQMVMSDANGYITFTGAFTSSNNVSGTWKTGQGNTGTFQ